MIVLNMEVKAVAMGMLPLAVFEGMVLSNNFTRTSFEREEEGITAVYEHTEKVGDPPLPVMTVRISGFRQEAKDFG